MEKQITLFGLPFSYYDEPMFPIDELSHYFSIPLAMSVIVTELEKRKNKGQYTNTHRIELPNDNPHLVIEIDLDASGVAVFAVDNLNNQESVFMHAILINLETIFSRYKTIH